MPAGCERQITAKKFCGYGEYQSFDICHSCFHHYQNDDYNKQTIINTVILLPLLLLLLITTLSVSVLINIRLIILLSSTQVRDGKFSKGATVVRSGDCPRRQSWAVTSSGRWMFVLFASDRASPKDVMTVTYVKKSSGNTGEYIAAVTTCIL